MERPTWRRTKGVLWQWLTRNWIVLTNSWVNLQWIHLQSSLRNTERPVTLWVQPCESLNQKSQLNWVQIMTHGNFEVKMCAAWRYNLWALCFITIDAMHYRIPVVYSYPFPMATLLPRLLCYLCIHPVHASVCLFCVDSRCIFFVSTLMAVLDIPEDGGTLVFRWLK